jgi:hypothetical protein
MYFLERSGNRLASILILLTLGVFGFSLNALAFYRMRSEFETWPNQVAPLAVCIFKSGNLNEGFEVVTGVELPKKNSYQRNHFSWAEIGESKISESSGSILTASWENPLSSDIVVNIGIPIYFEFEASDAVFQRAMKWKIFEFELLDSSGGLLDAQPLPILGQPELKAMRATLEDFCSKAAACGPHPSRQGVSRLLFESVMVSQNFRVSPAMKVAARVSWSGADFGDEITVRVRIGDQIRILRPIRTRSNGK